MEKNIFNSKLAKIYLYSLIKHNEWHIAVLNWMIVNKDKYSTLETAQSRFEQYVNLFAIAIVKNYQNLKHRVVDLDFDNSGWLVLTHLDLATDFSPIHMCDIWDINELTTEWLAATKSKENIQKLFDISEDLYKITSEYETLNSLQYHIEGAKKLKKLYPFVSIQTELVEKGFDYYDFEDVDEEMREQWKDWTELTLSTFKDMIEKCNKEFNLFSTAFDNNTLLQLKNAKYNNKLIEFVNNIK